MEHHRDHDNRYPFPEVHVSRTLGQRVAGVRLCFLSWFGAPVRFSCSTCARARIYSSSPNQLSHSTLFIVPSFSLFTFSNSALSLFKGVSLGLSHFRSSLQHSFVRKDALPCDPPTLSRVTSATTREWIPTYTLKFYRIPLCTILDADIGI